MYYIVAECASSASESADALNTVRFARGISYSDKIITTGYDDLDTTSEEDKNQTKRINEIMGFSHRFNTTTMIGAIIMRFQEVEKLTFREIFFSIFFHYLIDTFSLILF